MDVLAQSSLLVAFTSFALGGSVLARNVRNKLFLAFSALCALITGWALFFFLEKVWINSGFYPWHLLFNIWLGPGGLLFIQVMVRLYDTISRQLFGISVLMSLTLSCFLFWGWESDPRVLNLIYFSPVVILLQTMRQMWRDRKSSAQKWRESRTPTVGLIRRNLIYLGAIFVLTFTTLDHVPAFGKVVPSIGNLVLCAYLFLLGRAITQQRLLNFSALLSRFLVLFALALTLTIFYSLLVAWVDNNSAVFFLNSFLVSFLLVMLLDPLRRLVSYFTQTLLTQEHRKLEGFLKEAIRKQAGIVDPVAFFQFLVTTTEQILNPEAVSLFLLRGDGTQFRRVRMSGGHLQEMPLNEILADHPLLRYCLELETRGELPFLLDQILENEIDRSASRQQREKLRALLEAFKALRSNLLIPLFDGGTMLGFLAIYVSGPPESWGDNWGLLPLLRPFYAQAAQSLRSLEIYSRQREKERLAALGEMAAGLAHEIRNPLGAIQGAVQYLDPGVDRPESRFLQIIQEEVRRLNHVVTQFLDYSKAPTTELKPVDLTELASRSIELVRAGLPQGASQTRLEFVRPSDRIWVEGVADQLKQVILNLIGNSFKAVEGVSEPRVTLRIKRTDKIPGARMPEVVLIVEDNGTGIKKEHMEKLFIPFFTTHPSGTGLGLSISQKIVEAHRGRMDVQSDPGRFTRFSVILPELPEWEERPQSTL